MRPGIGYPSYRASTTWLSSGGFNAAFPVANVGNALSPRRVASIDSSAAFAITGVMGAVQPVQMVAVCHHTAPVDATLRVRLFSNGNPDPVANAGSIVYDSDVVPVWPLATQNVGFPACRPVVLPQAVSTGSVRLDFACATAQTWDIGFIEMSAWWSWADMRDDRSIGLDGRAVVNAAPGNVDLVTAQWSPRTFACNRQFLDIDREVEAKGLDFQRDHGVWNPFVFVDDADDPLSWPRRAFLARNRTLPATKVDQTLSGSLSFDLIEWLG